MKNWIALLLLAFPIFLHSQSISGVVKDAKTNSPLPYASIQISGTLKGTVANAKGNFELAAVEAGDTLVFAFLGYENSMHIVESDGPGTIEVKLSPVQFNLTTVIVRPLSPEGYIKAAVEAYPENFPSSPFEATGFFSEKSAIRNEKGKFYRNTQSIFSTYFPNYTDTTQAAKSVLNLYRMDSSETFSTILEDNRRIQKMTEDDENDFEIETPAGDGPGMVLEAIQGVLDLPFLKERNFKKVRFAFEETSSYLGRDLIVISFETKRRLDNAHYQGKVYIDNASLAFVSIDYSLQFRLPFYVNPLLRTFVGLRIKDIRLNAKMYNQELRGKWYPKDVLGQVQFKFKQSKQQEQWVIRQLFSISDIDTAPEAAPSAEHIFDPEKPLKEQVHNPAEVQWSDVNIVD